MACANSMRSSTPRDVPYRYVGWKNNVYRVLYGRIKQKEGRMACANSVRSSTPRDAPTGEYYDHPILIYDT